MVSFLVYFCIFAIFFAGIFIGRETAIRFKKYDGLFIVDDSNDQKTQWILDLKVDPDTIPNQKEIRLKVEKMDK